MNAAENNLSTSQELKNLGTPLETSHNQKPQRKNIQGLFDQIQVIREELSKQNETLISQEERSLRMVSDVCVTQTEMVGILKELTRNTLIFTPKKSLPFLDQIEISAKAEEDMRAQLMCAINETLDEFTECSATSAKLKEQCHTVKYEEIKKEDSGSQIIVHPQEELDKQIDNYHTSALTRVLLAVPKIQQQIRKELKKLTPFYNTLTPSQKIYRDEITKKGNEILLMANRLPFERDLIKRTLSLSPQMKHLSDAIAQSKSAISAQKDSYQDGVYKGFTPAQWESMQTYFAQEQEKFKEYTATAQTQEKILSNLIAELKPMAKDTNSLGSFFAHDDTLRELNLKNWIAMETEVNKERDALRTTLINQWKILYADLDDYSTQIAHIGDAIARKGFITKVRLLSTTPAKSQYANVELKNPQSLA